MIFILSVIFPALLAQPPLKCHDVFTYKQRVLGQLSRRVTQSSYEIIDNDFGFNVSAFLSPSGELRLTLYLSDPKEHIRSHLNGHKLFDQIIDHFGLLNIKSILGVWNQNSVNFRQYQLALLSGFDPNSAALKTWTAVQAKRYGFTKVNYLQVYQVNITGEWVSLVEFVRE